jgi:hypothetical protein
VSTRRGPMTEPPQMCLTAPLIRVSWMDTMNGNSTQLEMVPPKMRSFVSLLTVAVRYSRAPSLTAADAFAAAADGQWRWRRHTQQCR